MRPTLWATALVAGGLAVGCGPAPLDGDGSGLGSAVTLAYFIVFATTRPGGLERWVVYTLRNVGPRLLLAALVLTTTGRGYVRAALIHDCLIGCGRLRLVSG